MGFRPSKETEEVSGGVENHPPPRSLDLGEIPSNPDRNPILKTKLAAQPVQRSWEIENFLKRSYKGS